ncbi:MAG: hypothetical protein WC522_08440 [Candidatus Omnitrophota bacterium]
MSRNKIRFILGLAIVSAIFFYLRIKTLGHLLTWDEARNIISLRAFLSGADTDPFYSNYFFHPPLYMIFAALLKPFQAGLDVRLELLSLLFAYGTLVVTYILGARIGGRKLAFLSGLFLSLMPVSIAYDTWIKRDGLAALLGYLSIFFIMKRKVFWCAVALAFAMLAKESAAFFLLAVISILAVSNGKGTTKKILLISGTLLVLSGWWYFGFSAMPRVGPELYFQAERLASAWANSPLYYFKKLLPDMGFPTLIFFIMGVLYFPYLSLRKREYERLVPLIIFFCVYLPASFIIVAKTPWLCLSAAPALAMTAGGGALFLLEIAKKIRLALPVLASFIVLSIFVGASFSYDVYHGKSYPNGWSGANSSRELAFYLNKKMASGERLMLTQFSYWGEPACPICPIFLYYRKGGPVYVIDGKNTAEEAIGQIMDKKISWFAVIDSPDPRFNFHALVKDAEGSILGKPTAVGQAYVWRTDFLWQDK